MDTAIVYIVTFFVCLCPMAWMYRRRSRGASQSIIPTSVNFHFTRQCNFSCGFCFHTATTSHKEKIDKIKQALYKLKTAGMRKINFAGGEPFLEPKLLAQMCQFCKQELNLTVSIVSNGSLIKEEWMKQNGQYLDMLAISCDSIDEEVNVKIGRKANNKLGNQLEHARRAAAWCRKYNVKFKINTVVNAFNWEEDMNSFISELQPARWKVFQCLIIEGENDGNDGSKRDANSFLVTDKQFEAYIQRHGNQKCLVPEDNKKMRTSYFILDEYLRFLDCSGNAKTPGPSLIDTDVQTALASAGFDEKTFLARGGNFFMKEFNRTKDATSKSLCASSPLDGVGDIEDILS